MKWELFKDQFHESWHHKIKPFIESKECDKIYEFLKSESKRGKKIAPLSSLVYRCFKETPYNELNVILISYCPYHTFYNGSPVADGLAFSCSVTGKLQPSLEKFYEGLEKDLHNGLNLNYFKNPDLTYLAKQGILLYNAALTTEKDKAGSHMDLWEPFTKYLLTEVLAYIGVPIVFIGKDVQEYEKYVSPLTHSHYFKIEHPSFAARNYTDWETKGVFTKVTRLVIENNGIKLKWLDEDTCPF